MSLMLSCRRFHALCEAPLYKSIELHINLEYIQGPDDSHEAIEVLPRTLPECITSSPKCADLAALIPTVVLCAYPGLEDWVYETAGTREQLQSIHKVFLHMAPSRLQVRSYDDGHHRVSTRILERLNVSRLQYFDPGREAYVRGPIEQLPFFDGVLGRCGPTIKRLHFPETCYPPPGRQPFAHYAGTSTRCYRRGRLRRCHGLHLQGNQEGTKPVDSAASKGTFGWVHGASDRASAAHPPRHPGLAMDRGPL